MTPTITSIKRIEHARSTSPCAACGNKLLFSVPCYSVMLHVAGRAFTPRICYSCRILREGEIIAGLIIQAKRTADAEDIFLTDYIKTLAAQDHENM